MTKAQVRKYVADMKAGDMDGDGDTDIVVAIDEFRGPQLIYYSKNFFESFITVVLEEDAFTAPTVLEIADELDQSQEKVHKALSYSVPVRSMDVTVDDESDMKFSDLIADNRHDPVRSAQINCVDDCIQDWLGVLTKKQREIISRRFGLGGYNSATLEEIGNDVGITRERVRQIQIEALGKLRTVLQKQGYSWSAVSFS